MLANCEVVSRTLRRVGVKGSYHKSRDKRTDPLSIRRLLTLKIYCKSQGVQYVTKTHLSSAMCTSERISVIVSRKYMVRISSCWCVGNTLHLSSRNLVHDLDLELFPSTSISEIFLIHPS